MSSFNSILIRPRDSNRPLDRAELSHEFVVQLVDIDLAVLDAAAEVVNGVLLVRAGHRGLGRPGICD